MHCFLRAQRATQHRSMWASLLLLAASLVTPPSPVKSEVTGTQMEITTQDAVGPYHFHSTSSAGTCCDECPPPPGVVCYDVVGVSLTQNYLGRCNGSGHGSAECDGIFYLNGGENRFAYTVTYPTMVGDCCGGGVETEVFYIDRDDECVTIRYPDRGIGPINICYDIADDVDEMKPDGDDCSEETNSFIEERSRVFHEDIPVPGTGFSLHYASNRVKGYHEVIKMSVEDGSTDFCGVTASLSVAGRILESQVPSLPGSVQFDWDGLDAGGERVSGMVAAQVGAIYSCLGTEGDLLDFTFNEGLDLFLQPTDNGIAEGWTLSNHHYLDPGNPRVLYKGDGTQITNPGQVNQTVANMIGGDIVFAEGNVLAHVFTSSGRHERTVDLRTGLDLYQFGYDAQDRLISITNQFSDSVTIQRDQDGVPTAIVSPDGIATQLTIDTNNHLTWVTFADSSAYNFQYTTSGLMTVETDPEQNVFEHWYNDAGRVTDVLDQEQGHWELSRTYEDSDVISSMLTGEGTLTQYRDTTDTAGSYSSVITDPTGAETHYSKSSDGLTVTKTLPCGLNLTFYNLVDSALGSEYLYHLIETTPANKRRDSYWTRLYQDTNSDTFYDKFTTQLKVNNRTWKMIDETLLGKEEFITPQSRTRTRWYDPATLLTTRLSVPGLHNVDFGYDTHGRLTSLTQDSRVTGLAYNAQGFLASVTDPENQTTTYTYDAVGRVTGIDPPATPVIGFTYDDTGNMTVLTTPGGIQHGFGYNQVNRRDSYTTPLSGTYGYLYDKDRKLTRITFPSTNQINYVYDNIRLSQIQTPAGNIDYTYTCGTKVGSITKGTESISYGYDGPLVTSETLNGTINQTLTSVYNNDYRMTNFTYAGTGTYYAYDYEGLLTMASPYGIVRNTTNGLPLKVIRGRYMELAFTFNGYEELDAENLKVYYKNVASWNVGSRDLTGRTLTKTETVNGASSGYVYTYDADGRLLSVTKDGNPVEEYQYWADGTRSYELNTLRGISGRTFDYDNENHLLSAGSTTYLYDVDGFLTDKIQGSDTTEYVYSLRGELLQVDLPDGTVIEYIHDPLGRRIAKKVDGVIVEKYLWDGLTRLLAVYDGSDALLMRFDYALGRTPISMVSGGVTYYFGYDQVGSLRAVSNVSGTLVKRVDYDTFGNVIGDSNPTLAVPFGFAGGLHDRDTGLVRFGYRDYDPDVGRWTAKDPIGFEGGDTDLYGYCLNDPVNLIDPDGLFAHAGFIRQLAKMGNKSLRRTKRSLMKRIAEHEKKLADPCQELARKHHKHELRVLREQLKHAEKEASKRGLMGAGAAGSFAEDMTQEEAEEAADSWFDWFDPFLPGYAY